VEWLATEKILVHGSTGLAWNNQQNLVPELAQLNQLLHEHPCFFDGATLTRLSGPDSAVFALLRESLEGKDVCLVIVNADVEKEQILEFPAANSKLEISNLKFDLLGQQFPQMKITKDGAQVKVPAGGAYCLSVTAQPVGLSGDAYRIARAQAAWAVQALTESFEIYQLGAFDWRALAEIVARSPFDFLAAIRRLDVKQAETDLCAALEAALKQKAFPQVVRWSLIDRRRVTMVPPDHWLLIEDVAPFRGALEVEKSEVGDQKPAIRFLRRVESVKFGDVHVACFPADGFVGDAKLVLERYADADRQVDAVICFLPEEPQPQNVFPKPNDLVLLTTGRGGMSRLCVDLGSVNSKYDCVLGAN
jgi:hypothetical protein